MIFLSYNCRGVSSEAKKLALRDPVWSLKLDVIMMQETMGAGDILVESMSKLFPDWKFYALDANGHSRGVIMGFDTRKFREVSSWGNATHLGIGTLLK